MDDIRVFVERINRYMAERKKLDLESLYAQLKDSYPLILTTAFDNGYEMPILCGESSAGKFELYDNGLDIIFDIDKPDGTDTHWHPIDAEEAIEGIREFMHGSCKY